MKAYILPSTRKIEPFGEHPRECLIGNKKLGDIQKEVLQSLGITPGTTTQTKQIEDQEEYISFDDSLFFTKKLLAEFIKKSRRLNKTTICAIKLPVQGPYYYGMVATQDVKVYSNLVEYPLIYHPAFDSTSEPISLVIDVYEHLATVPLPEHMFGGAEYGLPMTEKIIVLIDHWANLHYANMAVSAMEPAKLLNSKLTIMRAILLSRSLNQWKLGHQVYRKGKNCDIHPTAWVEFSTLGDNVSIGAGTIVSGSLVGDGTVLANNVDVEYSIVGSKSYIAAGSLVRFSLLYPGTNNNTRLIQFSVCGKDTFLGDGVTLGDFRLDGKNISVMKNSSVLDSGSRLLGACLGHGVYLGAGCIIAPGRTIPNGIRLTPEKNRIIDKIDIGSDISGYRYINEYQKPINLPEYKNKGSSWIRRILRLPSVK